MKSPDENARSVTTPPTPEERKRSVPYFVHIALACRKYAGIRDLFVRVLTHTLSTNDVYQLDGYFGTLGHIRTIIEDYVDRIVDLRKAESRIDVALQRYGVALLMPPMTAPQTASRHVLRRYGGHQNAHLVQCGPSPFVEYVAYFFVIRALEAVTTKDKMLQAKREVWRAELKLAYRLNKWDPLTRLERPGATRGDHPSSLDHTDTMGQ